MSHPTEDGLLGDPRAVVTEHLDAFNQHSTDRLLDGFADDVVWATGEDVFRGKGALAGLFGAGLWELAPALTTVRLICQGDAVVAELREELTVDGAPLQFMIAVFFEISGGLIRRAKVYREGSADIPDPPAGRE